VPPLLARSPCVPYTTLFRSVVGCGLGMEALVLGCPAAFLFGVAELDDRGRKSSRQPSLGNHAVERSFVAQARVRHLVDGEVDHRSEEHTSELQSRENLVCRL